jgi:hypothetical protein
MEKVSIGGTSLPSGSYKPNWSILIALLEASGFELSPEPGGKYYLGLDHEETMYCRYIEQGGKPELAVLVRQETDSVYPGQYRKRVEKKYGLVLTLGGVKSLRKHDFFLAHAYIFSPKPTFPRTDDLKFENIFIARKNDKVYEFSNWKRRSIYFSFVGANKVGLSPENNYAVRRELVDEYASSGLEVYGPLWNDGLKRRLINRVSMTLWGLKTHQRPPLWSIYADIFRKYKNAKGEVPDKHAIILSSKFSLVVENSELMITEKLFDSILSGSIPVYYGPDLSQFGLPVDIAIEIKKIRAPIGEYLLSLTDEEIRMRLEVIQNFLTSSSFRDVWLAESVFLKAHNEIKSYFDEH